MKTIILLAIIISSWPVFAQSEKMPQVMVSIVENNVDRKAHGNDKKPVTNTAKPNSFTKNKVMPINNKEIDKSGKHPRNNEKEECWWDSTENVFTALMALSTFGLWVATVVLVINTKETSSKQIRAYVSASIEEGKKMFFDVNGRLSAPIIVKNYGQTPASELKCMAYIGLYKLPLSVLLDPPNYADGSLGCLTPTQSTRTYPTLLDELSDAQVSAIESGEAGIYVWGYIKYVDVFDVEQDAKFRLISTGSDFTRRELAYCDEGNEAS